MVGVRRGGHCDFDDNVLALMGIMVIVDSAIVGMAGLELKVVGVSGTLFFEERGDDASG